jgi:mycothiol synthase
MLTLPLDQTLALPAGYTARPARLDDVEATVAMLNAASRALLGVDSHTVDKWVREWNMPDWDLGADTQLVLAPDGSVAALGVVWDFAPHVAPEVWARVHPDHLQRGLGTYLLRWAQARCAHAVARAPEGARVVAQASIHDLDTSTQELLLAEGYTLVRHALRMVIALEAPPPAPQWPDGVSVRSYVPGQDDREALTVVRACFSDHWGYVEEPFEEDLARWNYFTSHDPEFDPGLRQLAIAGGKIIGTSYGSLKVEDDPAMGWISAVGVLRPWRRKGLAQALILATFRALYDRGQRKVGLGVDAESLTGATRLYEKVGMHSDPRHQTGIWERELRAAG